MDEKNKENIEMIASLKAKAYDLVILISKTQSELRVITQHIAELNKPKVPTDKSQKNV